MCLGFSQITITLPFLFITLHFSQIGLTDGLTFIANPPYFALHVILPLVRSYGESSTVTLSPGKILMKFILNFPEICANILCPLSNSTSNIAYVDNRLTDISNEIQQYVEANGFSVVRDFVGHGIGRKVHEDPEVPNFGRPGRGPKLMAGMVLAIEPMVNMGSYRVKTLDDGWTVVTADGKLSAHYENTVAILPNGPEILTLIK